MEKYCPMKLSSKAESPHNQFYFCEKEKCEWWGKRLGGLNIEACSIRILAENLFFIQEHLNRMVK